MEKVNFNKSLKKNYILNTILLLANVLCPLVTFPYVSRILLPSGTGRLSFATSIVSYFLLLAQLGIPTYAIRELAKVRDDKEKLSKTTKELFLINFFMSIISTLLLIITILFIPKLRDDKVLFLVLSTGILFQPLGMEWLFSAIEQYSYITKRSLLFKLLSLLLTFLLIHKQEDYIIYGGISVFSTSASYLLNFFYARKFIDFKKVNELNIKQHFKGIFVFFAMTCATTIYVNIDSVMLGFIKNEDAVGIYNTAVKVRTLLLTIVTSIGTVVLPRATNYIKNNRLSDYWSLIKKSMSFVLMTAIPLTIYFIIFSKESILLLAGSDYLDSVLPMQIILPTIIIVGISNVTGIQILIPMGKEKIVLLSEIIGAIVDFVLNIFLIMKYGPAGVAFATLIAEIFVALFQMIFIKKEVISVFKNKDILKNLIASILASFFVIFIFKLEMKPIFIMLISCCIYFFIYFLLLLLFKNTLLREIINYLIRILKKLFKERKNAKS